MKYPAALADWFAALTQAAHGQSLVKLALTKPTGNPDDLKSVDIRPILIKRVLHLSFTYHYKTRDIVKNHTPEDSLPVLASLMDKSFTSAKIFTLENDILLTKSGKSYTVAHHGPTQTKAPELSHDKPKNRLIEAGNKPYLHALGLTDSSGAVLKSAQDKFRQINKYIEVLSGLIKQLPGGQGPLHVLDMGSGKGYLTFALADYLAASQIPATVTGIEYRTDMVKLCNDIAHQTGFTNLSFRQGTIAESDCTGATIVIALHACDTATDDAIAKAIKAGAKLIVTAPCCHKQVRRDMKPTPAHPLHSMLTFGTYTEKLAEMLTDTLRAEILNLNNYKTNLFEFIGAEHTPKNVMITALLNPKPLPDAQKTHIHSTIAALKAHFGLKIHKLEDLL